MVTMFKAILLSILIIFPFTLIAGVLDVNSDAPALLKALNFILTFMSAHIQSQVAIFVTMFLSCMFALQLICRGLAELLGLFAEKTGTNIDNQMMMFFSTAALILGRVIGWFGVGNLPKSLS